MPRSEKQGSSLQPGDRPGSDHKPQPENAAALDEIELAVASYNEAAEDYRFTPCSQLTPQVRKRLKERLSEIGGLEQFKRAVSAIPLDDFLSGRIQPKGGRRPFKLNLERLLRTDGGMGDVLAMLIGLADEAARPHDIDLDAQHQHQERVARLREEEDGGAWRQ